MSSIHRWTGVLTFSVIASLAPQAHADLTMEAAIKASLEVNERAQIAALRVQAARGQLERARSAFFPTLTLGAGTSMTPYSDRSGRWRSTSTSLTLNQPLLNPSAIPQRAQAEHSLEAEHHGAVEDQRQLAFSTARAFIQAQAAERVLKAAESRAERAKANFENADARAKAQLNSINDATRAKVDMTSALQSVAQSNASYRQALLQLGLLMRREVQDTLEAPENISSQAKSFQGDLDKLTRAAIENRPDLRGLREQIRSAEIAATEPHYRMAPTINLSLQLRGNVDALPTERRFDESLSFNLSWTIFDGGGRYGDRKTRLAQAESLRLQQQLQYRTIRADVQSALLLLDAAKVSLQAAEEGVSAAKANTEETAILYQQGLARAIELTDANARRFDAEVSLASARQSLIEAYLQIRQVLGLAPIDSVALPAAAGSSRHAPATSAAVNEP